MTLPLTVRFTSTVLSAAIRLTFDRLIKIHSYRLVKTPPQSGSGQVGAVTISGDNLLWGGSSPFGPAVRAAYLLRVSANIGRLNNYHAISRNDTSIFNGQVSRSPIDGQIVFNPPLVTRAVFVAPSQLLGEYIVSFDYEII